MLKKLIGQNTKQVITIAKSKYETEVEPRFLEIEAWKRDGLTDEQIAKNLGIAYSTFREYKNKYSAFSAVLKKGKEIADIEVENALFKRAIGYKYKEVIKEVTAEEQKRKEANKLIHVKRTLP